VGELAAMRVAERWSARGRQIGPTRRRCCARAASDCAQSYALGRCCPEVDVGACSVHGRGSELKQDLQDVSEA
jgi:hypothetical protein